MSPKKDGRLTTFMAKSLMYLMALGALFLKVRCLLWRALCRLSVYSRVSDLPAICATEPTSAQSQTREVLHLKVSSPVGDLISLHAQQMYDGKGSGKSTPSQNAHSLTKVLATHAVKSKLVLPVMNRNLTT